MSAILQGIFLLLALHYVYDIQYHPRLKDFYLFLEDKLLGISTSNVRKSATYSSIMSALESYMPSMD